MGRWLREVSVDLAGIANPRNRLLLGVTAGVIGACLLVACLKSSYKGWFRILAVFLLGCLAFLSGKSPLSSQIKFVLQQRSDMRHLKLILDVAL